VLAQDARCNVGALTALAIRDDFAVARQLPQTLAQLREITHNPWVVLQTVSRDPQFGIKLMIFCLRFVYLISECCLVAFRFRALSQ